MSNYRQRLQEAQRESPKLQTVSQGDYEAWLDNPITALLMIDIELSVLSTADRIKGRTTDDFAVQGAMYAGACEMAELIAGWQPVFMEDGE